MANENVVLPEVEFVAFQRFCRDKGFDLCYYGPEIDKGEIDAYQPDHPKVIKVKKRRFSSVGIPYDVAEWQRKEWGAALPRLIGEFSQSEKGTEITDTAKPPTINSGEAVRQLADQLKNVFVAGLLSLWVATMTPNTGASTHSGSWWSWAIASVFVFFWMVWRREKIRWPKLKWVFPFIAAALMWVMYFIGNIPFSAGAFKGIGAFLLAGALLLFVALVRVITKGLKEGRIDRIIRRIVIWGGAASFPLSLLALMSSIVSGWARLESAGMRGWWTTPLLIFGVLILIVVGLAPFYREKGSGMPPS
jgi:hypothetical protein